MRNCDNCKNILRDPKDGLYDTCILKDLEITAPVNFICKDWQSN